MASTIREPTRADIPAILDLAEAKHEEYQRYQPTFWRRAGDSRERHEAYLAALLADERVIFRVHERDGVVDGFILGHLPTPPPVYDPGGPVCLIDDFATRDAGGEVVDRRGVPGRGHRGSEAAGAILAVVICGHLDQPKRAMLARAGYGVASEWHTRAL